MLYFKETDYALFVGTEQEGPMQGTETIFVVNQVNVGILDDAIQAYEVTKGRKVGQIYLGAGFLSKCTPDYIRHIAAFVETGFGDATMLTVEASYLDPKLLREVERIDHWVYTAMMLGSVNPNFKQTMQMLTNKELQKRLDLESHHLEKVSVKTDFGGATMVMAAKDVAFSKYGDYGDDKLLWAADGFCADNKVPHPMVVDASADPKKPESIDLTKMDPKAHAYEIKVHWTPRMIFRSQGE